jgi:ParB-like chromosome segregation protein Spo0J
MTGRETESAWRRAVKGLSSEVVVIPISAISFGQSLRQAPQDLDHARMLAEVDQRLPPIIVHAETMTVIDGCHRVLAARLRGEASVSAQMFHGTEKQAFLVGVHANTTHGKPLSLSERLLAARQILLTSPEMSDRAIANVCGLSARAVATRRKAGPVTCEDARVGADGRMRPLSARVAREQAAELMRAFPDDSNRKIGRSVGLSEATVRKVRHQMERSACPAPGTRDEPAVPDAKACSGAAEPTSRETKSNASDGSQFASWLMAHSISDASWADLVNDLPLSQCSRVIADALSISKSWRDLAAQLERRGREELT